MADLEFKVTEACQEILGCQVCMGKRVTKDSLELDFLVQVALKESAEFQELLDYQENLEDQDRMAQLDSLVLVDKRVNQDGVSRVPKVHKAPQELLASKGRRAILVDLAFLDEKVKRDYLVLRE